MITQNESVFFGQEASNELHHYIASCIASNRKVFIMVDENTRMFCLPFLIKICDLSNFSFTVIEIQSGEKYKSFDTIIKIWSQLTHAGADRNSVIVNLGGGILCDLGGFAASCYNRGIDTVHVPTTLLAMVDAAIGGKTGFDFLDYKNHIGSFYQPQWVLILSEFIETLDKRQVNSGLAEVVKYGFISNPEILDKLKNSGPDLYDDLIHLCVDVKLGITSEDPKEAGYRKVLNFGHTVGHAIESFALSHEIDILHGEAIAVGLLCELWLSVKLRNLNTKILLDYIDFYNSHFAYLTYIFKNRNEILNRMMLDKKNSSGQLKFVLINRPGEAVWDVNIGSEIVLESLTYYNSLKN
jgi:3-dehydroquinate synthase